MGEFVRSFAVSRAIGRTAARGVRQVAVGVLVWQIGLSAVLAEGMFFKNGRYDGEHTVLRLSDAQRGEANAVKRITLTAEQRGLLAKVTGGEAVPKTLDVMTLQEGLADCTCGVSNVGLWLRPAEVEVPHIYLANESGSGWNRAKRYVHVDMAGVLRDEKGREITVEKALKKFRLSRKMMAYTPPLFTKEKPAAIVRKLEELRDAAARVGIDFCLI